MWHFAKPKPIPPGVAIFNVLGEQIDFVTGVWDLCGATLKDKQWPHADLSGLRLDGANLEGANLFGARLVRASFSRCNFRGTELSFSNATQASFREANLDGCLMYRSETRLARFDHAIITETSNILRVVNL